MRRTSILAAAAAAAILWAAPARADGTASSRDVTTAVDAYLASANGDASLVGGAGSAGYDGGFWIRGGSFLLRINLTIQTRFEYFDWDDRNVEPSPGGDLSGFSLPRVTLKLSGDALCSMHYYAELEFGHHGTMFDNEDFAGAEVSLLFAEVGGSVRIESLQKQTNQVQEFGIAREAWIEWESSRAFCVRMGLLRTAATRQLMTPPEMEQFIDVSLASAFIGQSMPGYSDRNRDYGLMFHGALGCDEAWTYMATVTNGDGPVRRNVIDGTTDDPLAYSARINWDIKGHMGYEEGALKQHSCEWTLSAGAWGHYYVDHIFENPLQKLGTRMTYGVDLAAGWGGFSLTAAYSALSWDISNSSSDLDGYSYLLQVGYLFPDTAWEVAARYDVYHLDGGNSGSNDIGANEFGFAVNYYIDGHANKLTADAAFISPDDDGNLLGDVYAGYNPTGTSDGMLLRFQWQMAL